MSEGDSEGGESERRSEGDSEGGESEGVKEEEVREGVRKGMRGKGVRERGKKEQTKAWSKRNVPWRKLYPGAATAYKLP